MIWTYANTDLLDASSATNFTFKIVGAGLTVLEVNQINAINNSRKIRARIQAIYANGNILELSQFDNQVFKNNLVLIDSLMPKILANALLYFYRDEIVNMADICTALTSSNPVKYDQSLNHNFYEHKLKRFLAEVALGMMPNTIWTGVYAGTEGYVIVKKDGEVVCYHIINRNLFEDYLLENTKLETPSSTRHRFGEIYNVNGEMRIKLNLQIRFI